jgi:hypothetical protein
MLITTYQADRYATRHLIGHSNGLPFMAVYHACSLMARELNLLFHTIYFILNHSWLHIFLIEVWLKEETKKYRRLHFRWLLAELRLFSSAHWAFYSLVSWRAVELLIKEEDTTCLWIGCDATHAEHRLACSSPSFGISENTPALVSTPLEHLVRTNHMIPLNRYRRKRESLGLPNWLLVLNWTLTQMPIGCTFMVPALFAPHWTNGIVILFRSPTWAIAITQYCMDY